MAFITQTTAPTSRKIKVLIVDDSVTIRRLLRLVLSSDPEIIVVGEAENPLEARELIKQTDPDVVTLDVEMPKMDGLEFLRRLMRLRPTPVIMISTLTHKGSEFAVQALSLGAIDVFGKPQGPDPKSWQSIVPMVKSASQARVGRACKPSDAFEPKSYGQWNGNLIAIGASTGGVDALETVLQVFPADCPPVLIVQHMPALFLESLVTRLDGKLQPHVCLGTDGARLAPGTITFAQGGETHLECAADGNSLRVQSGEKVSGHRPSVDVLMQSLVPHAGKVVGCILTGMGRDGALGLKALHSAGGRTIAQDETTSVVYGMPRAAAEEKAVDQVLPIAKIGQALLDEASKSTRVARRTLQGRTG